MPELDGIEATRLLAGPDVTDPLAVVVITTFDLDEYVHGALKAGERREVAFEGETPAKSGSFNITAKTKDGKLLFTQSFPYQVNGFEPRTPVKPDKDGAKRAPATRRRKRKP